MANWIYKFIYIFINTCFYPIRTELELTGSNRMQTRLGILKNLLNCFVCVQGRINCSGCRMKNLLFRIFDVAVSNCSVY